MESVIIRSLPWPPLLFNVLAGRVFFHEENIRERFFGALLMVAGVVYRHEFEKLESRVKDIEDLPAVVAKRR